MAAGASEYVIAVVAAAVILVSLWPINAVADRLHGSNLPETQIRLSMRRVDLLGQVSEVLLVHKLEIAQVATQRISRDAYHADISIRGRNPGAMAAAIDGIARIDGVDVLSSSQAD
jgi:uncharacterized membrane protein YhiD involved in acid resistance